MLPLLLALALATSAPAPAPSGIGAGAPSPAKSPPKAERRPRAPEATPGDAPAAPVLRGFEPRSGKRFTGEFEDDDVADALREIASAAGWSLVLPGGRLGTVTAHLQDVPAEDALAAVLDQAELVAARQGSIVTVRVRPGATARAGSAATAKEPPARGARGGDRAARGRDQVVQGDVVVHAGQPARDVVAMKGSVRVEPGAAVRDAVAFLGNVVLEDGARARQAVAVGGDVRLGDGAIVEKDAVAVGGEVRRGEGAEVGGEEVGVGVPALSGLAAALGAGGLAHAAASPALAVGLVLAKFLAGFVVALLALALVPRRLDAVSASFTAHPWKAILTGLLGTFAVPLVAILLVATIVGIPLVAVLAVLVAAAAALGFAAVAWGVGRALPAPVSRATAVLQLAAGTAVVVLATSIPFLGAMAWIAAALLGFGAVLRSRFGSEPAAAAPPSFPPAVPPAA